MTTPKTAADFYHRGLRLSVSHKDMEGAIEAYGRSLELNPDNEMAYNNLATCLRQTGRNPEAMVHLRKAVALLEQKGMRHKDLEAMGTIHNNMGNAHRTAGEFKLAKGQYEFLIGFLPKDHGRYKEAKTHLGLTLSKLDDTEGCLRVRRELVQGWPECWLSRYNLASTLHKVAGHVTEEAIVHSRAAHSLISCSRCRADAYDPHNVILILLACLIR